MLCLDAKTGKELWKHEYDCPYQISYPAGPRCTPTVSGGKVYTLGTMGDLLCLDADNGNAVWKKDFKTDYKAETPMWGFCRAPAGGREPADLPGRRARATVVAFDKDTGKEVWKAVPGQGGSPGTLRRR